MTVMEHDAVAIARALLDIGGYLKGMEAGGQEHIIQRYDDVLGRGLTVFANGEEKSAETILTVSNREKKTFLMATIRLGKVVSVDTIDENDTSWIGTLQACYEIERAKYDENDKMSLSTTASVLDWTRRLIKSNPEIYTDNESGEILGGARYVNDEFDLTCRTIGAMNSDDISVQIFYKDEKVFEATYHDGHLREVTEAHDGEWTLIMRFLVGD